MDKRLTEEELLTNCYKKYFNYVIVWCPTCKIDHKILVDEFLSTKEYSFVCNKCKKKLYCTRSYFPIHDKIVRNRIKMGKYVFDKPFETTGQTQPGLLTQSVYKINED